MRPFQSHPTGLAPDPTHRAWTGTVLGSLGVSPPVHTELVERGDALLADRAVTPRDPLRAEPGTEGEPVPVR